MAVELKNCLETDAGIQYINRTPPYEWIFFLRGVFETPQTERLSAFVTVAEARGNVKGFLCLDGWLGFIPSLTLPISGRE